MCNYLEWELTAANPMLSSFEMTVRKGFREQSLSDLPDLLCVQAFSVTPFSVAFYSPGL